MSRIFQALQHAEKERLALATQANSVAEHATSCQSNSSERTDSGEQKRCAHLCFEYAHRLRREGLIDFLGSCVGLYPWQCSQCNRRFRWFLRYN